MIPPSVVAQSVPMSTSIVWNCLVISARRRVSSATHVFAQRGVALVHLVVEIGYGLCEVAEAFVDLIVGAFEAAHALLHCGFGLGCHRCTTPSGFYHAGSNRRGGLGEQHRNRCADRAMGGCHTSYTYKAYADSACSTLLATASSFTP